MTLATDIDDAIRRVEREEADREDRYSGLLPGGPWRMGARAPWACCESKGRKHLATCANAPPPSPSAPPRGPHCECSCTFSEHERDINAAWEHTGGRCLSCDCGGFKLALPVRTRRKLSGAELREAAERLSPRPALEDYDDLEGG